MTAIRRLEENQTSLLDENRQLVARIRQNEDTMNLLRGGNSSLQAGQTEALSALSKLPEALEKLAKKDTSLKLDTRGVGNRWC